MDKMFSEKERIYFTLAELEYTDTDTLTKNEEETIDTAINILYKAMKQDKHTFSEEEKDIICEAMTIHEKECA